MSLDPSPPVEPEQPTHSASGVDLTLIRWMLTLTPVQRIEHIEAVADSLDELRSINGLPRLG